ncbi:MAG: IS630 family transposase [Streptosporangiaceae bacterium]
MPLSAVPVTVAAAERRALKKRVRGTKTAWRDRLRAQIVLAAAMGRSTARIARDLRISQDTARKWRGRFADRGLEGLGDLARPGRPRRISAAERAAVVALACQLPAATGVPLSRWTGPELARELAAQALVSAPMSVSSLLRILAENPVRPWQYQSWIYPRDPDFAAKAAVILDLYQGFYGGVPLGPDDRIISVDAKPSIQARGRIHATMPAAPGRAARVEHEYVRHGALALLAALDIQTGKVFASTPKTTGIVPFMDLIARVMARPEHRDAPRVFVVVDNGSDHRGKAAADRLREAHPNAIMIHTPVHASWLNQVEIFFSIIQKKVVSPNDFHSLEKLSETLLAFVQRYDQTAKPFNWKFTAADLKDLLRRISEHDKQDATRQTDLTEAA